MENKRNLDHLLTTLLEVVEEKSVFIKTQQPRLHTLWDNFWDNSPLEIPQIRNIPLNKRKFISNLEYRAKILDNLSEAMKDGYNVVKTVVNFILLDYIQKGKFKDDFPQSSPDMVKYKIIDDMLGSLLQFVVLDNIPIPLDYIIVAKFKSLMKIKEQKPQRIIKGLKKDNIVISAKDLETSIQNLEEKGFIEAIEDPESKTGKSYKFKEDFKIAPEESQKYSQKIKQVIEWVIGLWRTLYNIRSLDTPVPENYPQSESLRQILSRAATQGYRNAQNVMENLSDYFDFVVQQDLQCP